MKIVISKVEERQREMSNGRLLDALEVLESLVDRSDVVHCGTGHLFALGEEEETPSYIQFGTIEISYT